jgi:uncharacterized integral membrane protein
MKRIGLVVLLVVLGGLALLFAALNHQRVELELAVFRLSAPVGVALITAFTAGMLLGVVWRVAWVAELLSERGRLRRALRLAEAQARSAEGRSHDA